jgi:VanZ family protein
MRIKIHLGYAIAAVGYMAGIFLLSSSPAEPGPLLPAGVSFAGKLLHIPLFAGLTACLILSLSEGEWSRRPSWRLYLLTGLIAVGYAVFDEWHQSFVPGRDSLIGDFLLNCVGVAALLVAHGLAAVRGELARPPVGAARRDLVHGR